ncbi:MAG: J domain-containing protein, partial [Planctomycetota bacterium]
QMMAGSAGRANTRTRNTRARQPQKGENLRHDLELPLELVVRGGETEFYLNDEKLAVNIPPGIQDGAKMRLRNQGSPSPNGGERGDLILVIRTSPHPNFRRSGQNLELTLPISIREAVLGTSVDVPTPNGTVTLTVPAGTSSGKKLRLKGQGVTASGSTGDLLVLLQIVVPESIDEESTELIKQFDDLNPMKIREDLSF